VTKRGGTPLPGPVFLRSSIHGNGATAPAPSPDSRRDEATRHRLGSDVQQGRRNLCVFSGSSSPGDTPES
jgi:hypothetical protein